MHLLHKDAAVDVEGLTRYDHRDRTFQAAHDRSSFPCLPKAYLPKLFKLISFATVMPIPRRRSARSSPYMLYSPLVS